MNARLGIVLAVLGCSVEPCPDGQRKDDTGFCVVEAGSEPGGEGGAAGAEPATGGVVGEGGAGTCENPSAFEDPCMTSADCRCEVNYCALQPGASEGICTRTGCVEDPSVCPSNLICFDLSVFDSSLPSICVPP
jgi:hypothetical protein